MSADLRVVPARLPVAQARCGGMVADRGTPADDWTSPGDSVDGRWHAADESERTALAHLRGWVHFGPRCPICAESRRAVAHATGQEVPPWVS
jgi:hypothetical protein